MCTLLVVIFAAVASASELSLSDVNNFLNTSARLGEGTKANQVAVIPFNHIDGKKKEDLFYAFVPFKYVAINYVKYQITFLACTFRPADLNVWSTAYVELTLPSSGKIEDAEVKFLSYDSDSTGHYLGGFWEDSNPSPIAPTATFEKFKAEMFPYYIGKNYSELAAYNQVSDFKDCNFDAWTGATFLETYEEALRISTQDCDLDDVFLVKETLKPFADEVVRMMDKLHGVFAVWEGAAHSVNTYTLLLLLTFMVRIIRF